MTKHPLSSVTLDDLSSLVALDSRGVTQAPWDSPVDPPDEGALAQLRYLTAKLAGAQPITLNEATVWSRAVYPLLELAETDRVRAWAEVPLAAKDPHSDTEIVGIVDGVLAPEGVFAGVPGAPFFLVMEAKRGMDATDPRPALVGALIAVLWTSLSRLGEASPLETFGCFTVGDIWTFVRAETVVRPADTAPRLGVSLSWSRAYTESFEADAILRVLRLIIDRARR